MRLPFTDSVRAPEGYRRLDHFTVPESYVEPPASAESREQPYGFLVWLGRQILRFQGLHIVVKGAENYPTCGGAVIASNHIGYLDPIFVMVPALLRGRRLIRFMGKAEVFDIPGVGPLMAACRHIPVDRFAGAGAFDLGIERVREGDMLRLFPEATISRSFELKDFKTGAARIAHSADVPIIPVAIFGTQRLASKGLSRNVGRSKLGVWVNVGKPVLPSADPAETTDRLREAMNALLNDAKTSYSTTFGPIPDNSRSMPAAVGGAAPTLDVANVEDAEERERKRIAREQKLAEKESMQPGPLNRLIGIRRSQRVKRKR